MDFCIRVDHIKAVLEGYRTLEMNLRLFRFSKCCEVVSFAFLHSGCMLELVFSHIFFLELIYEFFCILQTVGLQVEFDQFHKQQVVALNEVVLLFQF
ncbi:MAG: Uncharacterised protein [Flavobacteriia bacterium]|nr:MAG: Uncharacterised protein [Flavobacteriia bacterium]